WHRHQIEIHVSIDGRPCAAQIQVPAAERKILRLGGIHDERRGRVDGARQPVDPAARQTLPGPRLQSSCGWHAPRGATRNYGWSAKVALPAAPEYVNSIERMLLSLPRCSKKMSPASGSARSPSGSAALRTRWSMARSISIGMWTGAGVELSPEFPPVL